MTEKLVKEGFALAEEEMRKKQIQEVKQIVLKTLERIREQEKIRDEAIDKIKILKMDIDDLKDGKLDRIVERQEKDESAKTISVVTIIKEIHHHYNNPWYVPYRIIWHKPFIPYYRANEVLCVDNAVVYTDSRVPQTGTEFGMITCSAAKDATIGAYSLTGGEVVNLR
jgi:FtsZ-binding cell division protein ZapB